MEGRHVVQPWACEYFFLNCFLSILPTVVLVAQMNTEEMNALPPLPPREFFHSYDVFVATDIFSVKYLPYFPGGACFRCFLFSLFTFRARSTTTENLHATGGLHAGVAWTARTGFTQCARSNLSFSFFASWLQTTVEYWSRVCPMFLDNFSERKRDFYREGLAPFSNFTTHPYWYHYPVDLMRSFAGWNFRGEMPYFSDESLSAAAAPFVEEDNKKNRVIFLGKRNSNVTELAISLQAANWTVLTESWGSNTMTEYYNLLSKQVKYCIYLDPNGRKSPCQVCAEMAIFGIPVFGWNNKVFRNILFPSFCTVQDEAEAVRKINILEEQPDLYLTIREAILLNVWKLRYEHLQSMEDLVLSGVLPTTCTADLLKFSSQLKPKT